MTDAVTLDPPPLPGSPPSPLPGNPPPLPGLVRFVGPEWAYWQLRIKGAALLLVTLGIYRFWLMTDVRRFLWSNTEIAGETLEYDGLATELLVVFLFAIALLIPIYVAIALASLELDLPDYASALGGLALFVVFGEFARYRARRYRLTRTVFRGVRFHQRARVRKKRGTIGRQADRARRAFDQPLAKHAFQPLQKFICRWIEFLNVVQQSDDLFELVVHRIF